MHSIHFSYALGAVLAPLLAAPFLNNKPSYEHVLLQGNETTWVYVPEGKENPSQIQVPFFIMGAMSVVVSLGFLHYGIVALRRTHYSREPLDNETESAGGEAQQPVGESAAHEEAGQDEQQQQEQQQQQESEHNVDNHVQERTSEEPATGEEPTTAQPISWNLIITIALFTLFCFFYVGIESTYGLYLTAFAVHCNLHLSKARGALITSIYWGCFATMRFIAIWASIALNPLVIMTISFVLCLISSIALVFFGETYVWVLEVIANHLFFSIVN